MKKALWDIALACRIGILLVLSGCVPTLDGGDGSTDGRDNVVELGEPSEQPYAAFGPIEVGSYTPLEEGVDGGRLIFITPAEYDDDPDINLTGPNDFRHDFEVEFVTIINGDNGLEPGVYTFAATDEDMQLAEAKVEVREGQALAININLLPLKDLDYNLSDYEPYGRFEVMSPEPLEGNYDTGTLVITSNLPEDVGLHITGPNNYAASYREDETIEDLESGLYSVAATADDHDIVQGFVEVTAGLRVEVHLELKPFD